MNFKCYVQIFSEYGILVLTSDTGLCQDPAAAKRGKAAEQGKQAASGGKVFLE